MRVRLWNMIASVNPANGETLRTFSPLTDSQIEDKLVRAEAAYSAFRHTRFSDRAQWLERAAAILETERESIARLVTLEMGKPLKAAAAEAAKCASASSTAENSRLRSRSRASANVRAVRSVIRDPDYRK